MVWMGSHCSPKLLVSLKSFLPTYSILLLLPQPPTVHNVEIIFPQTRSARSDSRTIVGFFPTVRGDRWKLVGY